MRAPPYRTWIGVMIFFTTFTNYMLRSSFSVTIVAMKSTTKNYSIPYCLREKNATVHKNKTKEKSASVLFDWNEKQQGLLLAAYFYGYFSTMLFGGTLSELIGPWHVVFWTSVVSTILTVLGPISSIYGGFTGTFINRFLTGFFGGPIYPSLNVIVAKWAPPKEKGKFMAAMLGNTIGTVFGFSAVGAVAQSYKWEWTFYLLTIFMIVYLIAFFFIVSDSPDKCRWVSQDERDFITEEQGTALSKKKAVAPFLKILKNGRFWSTTAAQFGNAWTLNLILTYLPKYLKGTIGFDVRNSGFVAALPYLGRMAASATFGVIADKMRTKEVMSLTKMRKFFIIFSHFLSGVCLLPIGAAGCNTYIVVTLAILNQVFNGAVTVSHFANPQDLSPNFAGTVFGIMNFVAMTTGFIIPSVTGAILEAKRQTPEAASYIYCVGGIVLITGGIIFVFFGSAEVQAFNEIKDKQQQQPKQE